MNITDKISTKVYFLGQGSFAGNELDENLHSKGWVFIKDNNGNKFYGKAMNDDFGFFVVEIDLFKSTPYKNQFINYNGVSISDNTIIQQDTGYHMDCYELSGGNNEMNSFKIYYFTNNRFLTPQINNISRRWESLLIDYVSQF